ncbi:MAG: hypothetical protein PHE24_04355 [Patescibacteria group bacterium]|nr:hypothetical protein [Patescibacteria group bacterium]
MAAAGVITFDVFAQLIFKGDMLLSRGGLYGEIEGIGKIAEMGMDINIRMSRTAATAHIRRKDAFFFLETDGCVQLVAQRNGVDTFIVSLHRKKWRDIQPLVEKK